MAILPSGIQPGGSAITNPLPATTASANFLPALAGMSAIASAYGSIQRGKARKSIADANKFISELKAKDALRRGGTRAAKSRQRIKKIVGKQRANLAAQGIRLGVGSAQDIQQETQDIGELDALTIRTNAAREAFGFRTQAEQFGTAGRAAEREGKSEAVQTLLTGGLRAASLRGF
jgi:hypothetical protein